MEMQKAHGTRAGAGHPPEHAECEISSSEVQHKRLPELLGPFQSHLSSLERAQEACEASSWDAEPTRAARAVLREQDLRRAEAELLHPSAKPNVLPPADRLPRDPGPHGEKTAGWGRQ